MLLVPSARILSAFMVISPGVARPGKLSARICPASKISKLGELILMLFPCVLVSPEVP